MVILENEDNLLITDILILLKKIYNLIQYVTLKPISTPYTAKFNVLNKFEITFDLKHKNNKRCHKFVK